MGHECIDPINAEKEEAEQLPYTPQQTAAPIDPASWQQHIVDSSPYE
jgi:hypothetical protein